MAAKRRNKTTKIDTNWTRKQYSYIPEDELRWHYECDKKGINEIAKIYGMDRVKVREFFDMYDIEVTNGKHKKDVEDMDDWIDIFHDRYNGMTVRAIYEKYGFSPSVLRRVFKEWNVEPVDDA